MDNFNEKFSSQLVDPVGLTLSIGKLAYDLYHNRQDNSNEVAEVYQDIQKVIDACNSSFPYECIRVNAYIMKKYPEIVALSNGEIIAVSSDSLSLYSEVVNLYSLALMLDPLYKIMEQRKNKKKSELKTIAKAVAGHVAISAIATLLKSDV